MVARFPGIPDDRLSRFFIVYITANSAAILSGQVGETNKTKTKEYKTSPEGLEKKYHMKRVPTLIILSQGQEINRIVERPWRSLEEDLLAITQDQSYLPRYSLWESPGPRQFLSF